ncbi:hypothetical protein QZH41_018555, partial [Actinostola sp. cb2023]
MSKKLCEKALPGWRNEPKFRNRGVLIGNWFEERLQFTNNGQTGNSTNRKDYCIPETNVTDSVTRRKLAQRNWEGVGEHNLLTHHGQAYKSSAVSNYLLDYDFPQTPAPIRRWDRHNISWVPERIDVPLR